MKSYMDEYKNKLITVDEAAKMVKSNTLVHYGEFTMASAYFDEALARRMAELENVAIRSISPMFALKTVLGDPEGKHFYLHDSFYSPFSRYLADNNYPIYHLPTIYSEIPDYYWHGEINSDIAYLSVGPMDEHGYFNFGPSTSGAYTILRLAKTKIIEINDKAPKCLGGSEEAIHISDIDYIVEGPSNPLMQVPSIQPAEDEAAIAKLIVERIEDGACLQLGIGGMPNMVGQLIAQSDLMDLGVHTEMMGDSYVDMWEAGRITGKRKAIDKMKMVYTFAMGSNKLYEFLNNNPVCAAYPCDYTNDPIRIASNDNVVSINSSVEMDLFGQINSESSGIRQISGCGGQLDFLTGAYKSKGGKAFICMTSTKTSKKGELVSRIQPTLSPGTTVTIQRGLVNYLVTEYGIVWLKGLTTWQRAEALISIAHPQFRDELVKEAEKMNIWRKSNKIG